MKRRSQSDHLRNVSVDSNARDRRHNVMFPQPTEYQGVPVEDARSTYSRLTSTSSQRTGQRHVSMLEASRHRLSIRKLAAFPMQQTAPKPFLACCADITRYGRNWNAEFQLAWEAEDNTISQAMNRMEALRRIEKEFVEEAIRKAKQIVTLDDDGPRELPKFLQCYRVDNIFFRVLPDSRSGRNYVASLRGVLQSRSRLLTVPLSCMIFYRGMPVLAQALVPMSANPTRLYGADSTNDSEVEAEILHMADALNIPFPDGTLEVYEGLDGRLYLTNSNSTLTPLFVDDTIMKRQEMLRLCGNVTDGHADTVSLLDNAEVLDRVVQTCVDGEPRPCGERLRKLCDLLHSVGINMCLLKQVVCKAEDVGRYPPDVVTRIRELISVEMIARSIKQEFYVEVQGKRVAYDDDILAATVSKHIGAAFTNLDSFRSLFLEVVAKKYGVIDSDESLIKALTDIRTVMKADIVARVCALLGVSIEKTSKSQTTMRWHAHVNASVLPKLIDPQHVRSLSEKYRTIVTQDCYRYAFCLPVRWKVACWDGRYEEALTLVRETAKAHTELCAPVSLSPLYSRRSVCEVCFATMEKEYIIEGRNLFPDAMRGFEELTGPVTQGRLHIEYGFWLLRVATLYQSDELATYRSCVEEAAKHFYKAVAKLPGYLKSEHGAWLHLQPYKGLLQCKQLLPSCSVSTKELVGHSVELSTIGWASDFFMYYLWDLSLQLESEGRYDDAIRVLLTAITISKKKPTESRDLPSLLTDGAHIYRSWDREKYVEHCMTLLREAGDKAAELFGTHSREYAIVQNNRGAIEIDLNRLNDAGESLTKAGVAFGKARVPEDDPDFLAYLDNLRYHKERLFARPVIYRGVLQRYPFLATRDDDFPFSDVRLLEDEVFVELAHKRSRMKEDTAESRQLEQAMKERMWELLRTIQEGDILKQYPFLRAEVHGVRTASLRLEDDVFFRDLVHRMNASVDCAQTNALEFAMCEYVAKKAKDAALERAFVDRQEQEFSDAHGGYVNLMLPIPWVYVLEDERVRTLIDQIKKCTMSQSIGPCLAQIQGELASRVDEFEREAFQWRKELTPWLSSSKRYSVSATDLSGDAHLHDLLRVHRLHVLRGDPEVGQISGFISTKLEAMWERSSLVRTYLAVDDEEIHRQLPFLEERPYHQRLSTLRLHEDPTVAALLEQLEKEGADSHLQTELAVAVHHLAARRHDDNELQKLNYDVESFTRNFPVETVPNMRDDYYIALCQRRNAELKSSADDSPSAVVLTHRMEDRVLQMNVWVRKVHANRFRRRRRLESKYPFLSRRHAGFTLDVLNIEDDDEFMALVAAREILTATKPLTIVALDELNKQANNRVTSLAVQRMAHIKEHNQKYPYIPSRMEGMDTSTMHLEENQWFAQKAEQYSKLLNTDGEPSDLRRKRLVREMLNHILAIAREINVREWREAIESEDLRERYPFLPEEPLRGVLLTDLHPTQQPEFRALSNELDELRRDPTTNAEGIAAMEEKLRAVVVRLAEESAASTEEVRKQYPFLPKRVMGLLLGELPIKDDDVFTTSEKEDTEAKESILQARLVQLASNAHLSEVLLADADDTVLSNSPFLIYTTRKCFPLRHIRLHEDNTFNQLLEEHKVLLQSVKVDEDSIASVRFRLACRADEVALEEIKKIKKILELFHELKPLSLEDIKLLESKGVLESVNSSLSGTVPQELLAGVREVLESERRDRAAKVRKVDELRKAYPILGRNIDPSMLHNPLVAKLVDDHDALLDDMDKNAEKLQRLEAEIARTTQDIMTSTPSDASDDELPLNDMHIYVEEQIQFDRHYRELQDGYDRVKGSSSPAELMQARVLQTRMGRRKHQILQAFESQMAWQKRRREKLLKNFKNMRKALKGIAITSLDIQDDPYIQKLEEEAKISTSNETIKEIENKKTQRVLEIVGERRAEEESLAAAYPFLGRSVKGIPLAELHLMSDPAFAELASRYHQDTAGASLVTKAEQEQMLRDAADNVARDLRSSRLRTAVRAEGLRERYPFLPEEPLRGVLLTDLHPTQQPEFRALSNELDELRRDPTTNAEGIAAMEEKLRAVVVRLAEESAASTEEVRKQYPFLPKRVMGLLLGELPIKDDALLLQLNQRRVQQAEGGDGGEGLLALEGVVTQRVGELARLAKLAERESGANNEYVRACNPFLTYEDRKCVLLSDIPLSKDAAYQRLFGEHLAALEDAETNAQRLTELEEAMRIRADELAFNEAVRCASLRKYPFLASRNDGSDLSLLLADATFQQQCAQHDELTRDPEKNAEALRQLEREMSSRLKSMSGSSGATVGNGGDSGDGLAVGELGEAGVTRGAEGLSRQQSTSGDGIGTGVYPFLPRTFCGLSQAELYLEDDPYFQELLVRYNELVPVGGKSQSPPEKQLYERLCRRAGQIAGDVLKLRSVEDRSAVRSASLFLVDPSLLTGMQGGLALEEDGEVCELLKMRDEESAKGADGVSMEVVQEAKAGLIKRVLEIVGERRAEEESLAAAYPFLGRSVKGIPLAELHLMSDPAFAELASRYHQDTAGASLVTKAEQEQMLRDAADNVARDLRSSRLRTAVRAEGLRERYPFLPEEPLRGVLLTDLHPTQQPEFRALSNELDELRRDPTTNAEGIAAMEEKLRAVVVRLAEESAASTEEVRKQYPFLPKRVMGLLLGELPIKDDALLLQLNQRRVQQAEGGDGGEGLLALEGVVTQRVGELARLAKLAERESGANNEYVRACNPFLTYEDRKCVLLSDIPLSKDAAYQRLFGEHLAALEDAETNAQRLTELEEAMRIRADELAFNEAVRCASLRKYPFLASRNDGSDLSLLLADATFQQQCAQHDELTRDPEKNAEALRQLEREMSSRLKSMSGSSGATVGNGGDSGDGLAVGELGEAGVTRGAEGLSRQQSTSGDGIGTGVYPFLPRTFCGLSQAELYLEDDPYFQELLVRYNELVPVGGKSQSPPEKQLYERLCRRAGQIAGDVLKLRSVEDRSAVRSASLFLVDPSLLTGMQGGLALEEDGEVCELLKMRDEESAKGADGVSMEVVQEAKAGLIKRVLEIVGERRAEEESLAAAYPFLGRSVKGIPLAELHLMSDPAFAELASRYHQDTAGASLVTKAEQEQMLRDAADNVARDLRSSRLRTAVRAEGLRERYPFLPEEPLRGVLLTDLHPTQQPEFRALSNELDELRRDPTTNAEGIAAMEEKLRAVVVRLAEESAASTEEVRKQYPFLPKRVMGLLLGELPIKDDALLLQLNQRRVQQAEGGDGGEGLLALEGVVTQRVGELARLAKLAERESGANNEYVRACNPFLTYEDRKCVLLSDIPLSKDAAYQRLFGEHLAALEDAETNAQRLTELEEAMRIRADELAFNEAVRCASLRKYPFLASRNDGSDLSLLLADATFQQQCAQHDELTRDPEKNAEALRQLEREMSSRLKSMSGSSGATVGNGGDSGDGLAVGELGEAGVTRGAEGLSRQQSTSGDGIGTGVYPFLPRTFCGLSQAELYLEDDPYFQELLVRYNELVPVGGKSQSPPEKQLYERLCRRAGQIAGDVLKLRSVEDRSAVRSASLFLVDPSLLTGMQGGLALEEDGEVCELLKMRDEESAKGADGVSMEVVQEAKAGLIKRVLEIVGERRAEEESLAAAYPFLGRSVKGIPLAELHLMSDPAFAELASRYHQDTAGASLVTKAEQEQMLRDAADNVARDLRSSRLRTAVRAEGLRERYPFLPEEPLRGVLLTDLHPTQQPEFRALSNELDELRRDPTTNAEGIAAMEEKLRAVVVRLAEESAASTEEVRKQYPFLPKRVMGLLLGELPIKDDALLLQLNQRRVQQAEGGDGGEGLLALEGVVTQRVGELARLAKLAERESGANNEYVRACNPFLTYEDRKCVLLSDIPLSKDAAYQRLFGEHLAALEDAETNAQRLTELEEAMRIRADELAFNEAVRCASLRKYPFLASRNDGSDLSLLLADATFQQQCAQHDELTRDPEKNAEALRQLEREMSSRLKSMSGSSGATVGNGGDSGDGLAVGELGEAGVTRGAEGLSRQQSTSGDGIGTGVYPFLPRTFCGLSQAELYLEDDPYFQELLVRYNELVPVGGKSQSPPEKQLYERLCRRAGQIAGDVLKLRSVEDRSAVRSASLFLVDPSLLTGMQGGLALEEDGEVCELLKMRDEESAKGADGVSMEVVQEAKAGLIKRVLEIVGERRAEEESLAAAYPFLGRSVKGIPLAELHLMSDPAFAELASRYHQDTAGASLVTKAEQEQMLRDAADNVARDLRSSRLRTAVRAEGLRERYPFLPEEPLRGVLLTDLHPTQQPEFRALSNELDELRRDPTTNAEGIAAMEEKLRAVVVRLAEESAASTEEVRKQYPFLPKRVMGLLLGELPIKDDALLLQLNQRRVQQAEGGDGGEGLLALEGVVTQRVGELARLAKLAERESGANNEYVRACNPFLTYEDRKCVLLSDIPLSKDAAYQRLFGEHLAALEDAETNAQRLTELEEAMRIRADELAFNEAVRCASLRKYPFLASRNDGSDLSLLLADATFQQQCAQHDELTRDPEKNAEALRQLEREMSSRLKSMSGSSGATVGMVVTPAMD